MKKKNKKKKKNNNRKRIQIIFKILNYNYKTILYNRILLKSMNPKKH